MDPGNQEILNPSTSVAIVAPVWLQSALVVLLHSAPELRLIACTATVQVLLSLDLGQIPDLVILEADKNVKQASEQVNRIKTAWQASGCIALAERSDQQPLLLAAGADEVLLKGAAPEQLMKAIDHLKPSAKGGMPEPMKGNGP